MTVQTAPHTSHSSGPLAEAEGDAGQGTEVHPDGCPESVRIIRAPPAMAKLNGIAR